MTDLLHLLLHLPKHLLLLLLHLLSELVEASVGLGRLRRQLLLRDTTITHSLTLSRIGTERT